MQSFHTKLKKFDDAELWHYYIEVDRDLALSLMEGSDRRVLCSINGGEAFQCAIMKGRNELYFINVNKAIREAYGLEAGKVFTVSLQKDESKYGLPFPEEFEEVLAGDALAKSLFDQLSPGKKRNLLYIVNKYKSSDKRIEKALIIAQHLRDQQGKLDFKILNAAFRKGI